MGCSKEEFGTSTSILGKFPGKKHEGEAGDWALRYSPFPRENSLSVIPKPGPCVQD